MYEDEIVGIISGFPVKEKEKIDKISGRAFMKTMGVFSFMRKMPLFMKMGNITGGEMDEDGYYIHTISVNSSFQGRGIGREVIKKLCEKHKKIYLHVNTNKFDAQAFYRKVGFIQKHKGTTVIKGKEIGTFLMEKKCD